MELNGAAKINNHVVQVTTEQIGNSVDVPRQPVEEGISITDHVGETPQTLSLSGALMRPTQKRVEQLVTALEELMNKGKLITYEGRKVYTNMLIESLDIEADASISNGYRYSMSLVKARVTKATYIKATKPKTNEGRKQPKNKKPPSTRKYHLVKAGDTYWALGQKYGVRWQQLEQWNGYPPKLIPIGVKLRVS